MAHFNRTHGHRGQKPTPEYSAWISMRYRCNVKTCRAWKNYGGRGIAVCDRWNNSFENFLSDVGPKPGRAFDLNRINNDGNYEPGNVVWATRKENIRNTRANFMIEIDGVRKCAAEWAEKIGVDRHTVLERYKRGWRGKDLLTNGKIETRSVERRAEAARLREQGWKVREIAEHLGISQPSVSNHLTAFYGYPGKTYRPKRESA